ncbi:hypothetical protein J4Q44_G00391840 [Coregonus suidteri]|uniref:Uncharacterized protein n=1 Tax=Coregonus suidteri TaxID=861788 RepID=A0AAN8QBP8_9TELE
MPVEQGCQTHSMEGLVSAGFCFFLSIKGVPYKLVTLIHNNNKPFSRRFYPKQLTVMCAYIFTYGWSRGSNPLPWRYKRHALPIEPQRTINQVQGWSENPQTLGSPWDEFDTYAPLQMKHYGVFKEAWLEEGMLRYGSSRMRKQRTMSKAKAMKRRRMKTKAAFPSAILDPSSISSLLLLTSSDNHSQMWEDTGALVAPVVKAKPIKYE